MGIFKKISDFAYNKASVIAENKGFTGEVSENALKKDIRTHNAIRNNEDISDSDKERYMNRARGVADAIPNNPLELLPDVPKKWILIGAAVVGVIILK